MAYASANARGWSIGGQNPNLRTGVIHGGRSADLSVFRLTTNLKRATATAASQSTKPFLSCISRYSRKCFTLVAGREGLEHLIVDVRSEQGHMAIAKDEVDAACVCGGEVVDVDGRRRPAIRFTRVRQHTIRGIVGLEHHFARGPGNLLAAGYRPDPRRLQRQNTADLGGKLAGALAARRHINF